MGNLTLQGATSGETVLSRISGLSDGDTTSNPNYFWSFDLNCRAITITNLAFDSTHTHRYGAGQHVRFLGKHLEVQYCTFRHAPNYAIEIADGNADSAAEYIHIDSNSFIDCFGDPIHVHNGSDVWIVGNYIQNSGDDAIAVVADDFEADGLKASNVHILSNNINGSQWRGIAIVTADDVHIENNFIHGGSRHGIEITPIATEHNTAFDGDVPENQWAHGVSLLNNTIQYAGYPPDHDGLFHQDACGLIQKNVRNVTATGNTIHDIKGHGIYLRWVTGAEYGSLSQIWSFGTGGAGDGIRGEGYMANISTWFYSPGN